MSIKESNQMVVQPSSLSGEVLIPPSKSISHRAIICASLAPGRSVIDNIILSQDILATIEGMRLLGADIRVVEGAYRHQLLIDGIKKESLGDESPVTIDCRESGSTLRFLIPLALTFKARARFEGQGKLVERPLDVYTELFASHQIDYSYPKDRLPLEVSGPLEAGDYRLRGDVSSQFISGLLFALARLNRDSRLILTTELESKAYVDLTLDMLSRYGIRIDQTPDGFFIPGNQTFRPSDYRVEGDYSQSIFFMLGGVLSGSVSIKGLDPASLQGDAVVVAIMQEMGAEVSFDGEGVLVANKSTFRGIDKDCSEFPDLVPALAVMCACAEGTSRLTNLERLTIKECDRLQASFENLKALGALVERTRDELIITGQASLLGGQVSGWNDHRMVMSMAMAGLRCKEGLSVSNLDSVSKSYPNFWQDYQSLGGDFHERTMG